MLSHLTKNTLETSTMNNDIWTWQHEQVIPSDVQAGREVLDEILRELETQRWNRREIFCIHLAVHEALINAIIHGNKESVHKKVRCVCRLAPTKLRVEITDEGSGFNPKNLPDPTSPECIERAGGRGVLLMKAFMSKVDYNDRGNTVILEKERHP